MTPQLQIELLDELLQLQQAQRYFLDPDVHASPNSRYADPQRFQLEMEAAFRDLPQVAAHASELPNPGDFLTRDVSGQPVLLTRDAGGKVHAFVNVCRHRGAQLVGESSGCKKAFACPYHAWTWSHTGELLRARLGEVGFPELNPADYALRRLAVAELGGLIWVRPQLNAAPEAAADIDAFVQPLLADLAWLDMAQLGIATQHTQRVEANWKLIVEGGIEAYHFKVAHRDTIGPHFMDNLSSYRMLGPHMRSVLPRASLPTLATQAKDQWDIRAHANVLYNVFPGTQFLVMQDHIAWVTLRPLAVDHSEVTITVLVPQDQLGAERQAHWARNQHITVATLNEDFALNAAQQRGVATGANAAQTFGRFEGALHRFNAEVERCISPPEQTAI